MLDERFKCVLKCGISPHDVGIRPLQKELDELKRLNLQVAQQVTRVLIKSSKIDAMAQQKWAIDQNLSRYLNGYKFHPIPFHRQSVYIDKNDGTYNLHINTKSGDATCTLHLPSKKTKQLEYRSILDTCLSEGFGGNEKVGQVELIEDNRDGWINTHIVLRLICPVPYAPKGWIGVDVGWHKLATNAYVSSVGEVSNVGFLGADWKTRIIRLKYLSKLHQVNGKTKKVWRSRLKHVTQNAVGNIAKQLVTKAKSLTAGIVMEKLNFQSSTKRMLIPRFKLFQAVSFLCKKYGVPFQLVSAKNTSQICNKCGHRAKQNREAQVFKCIKCRYEVNADVNASINIAKRGIAKGYTPLAKGS
jgi:transposase